MTAPQTTGKLTEVTKANAAIHVDSRELTLTHRKAFNILLYNAWDEITKNKVHSINASELAHWLGFHDITRLKFELEKLPFIKVAWNILRDDGWPVDQGVCGLLAGFRMVGNSFRYSFFEDFRPYLRDPKLWTKVKIEIANLFNSNYALCLYETCNRFSKVGSTGWIEIDDWREMLGIPATNTYKTFGIVNKKILKPAIEQVNKLSDLTISSEFKRKGRGGAFSHMRFEITKKADYRLPERQARLPLKKEDVALAAAKIIPIEGAKNPAREYLEKMKEAEQPEQPKPIWIKFPSPPSADIRHLLNENGFKYISDGSYWLNTKAPKMMVHKIMRPVAEEEGILGWGLKPKHAADQGHYTP